MTANNPQKQTTRTFLILWLGQSISLIGSGLTSFALGVWVFQLNGSVTQFALIGLCAVIPKVFLSPFIGPLVDRWPRRKVILLSDLGAGLSTLAVVFLLQTGVLQVWHIYLATLINASFSALQWPAFMATTSQLISKENLGRANGLIQLGRGVSEILAPALAGVLLPMIGLAGIVAIDFTSFIVAAISLSFIRFPQEIGRGKPAMAPGRLKENLTFGWRYIAANNGLSGLLVFFALVNFLWGLVGVLLTPMILGFTNSQELGGILSVAGIGMLSGSLLMSVWGGTKRLITGVFIFEALSGVCFILMGARPSFWLIALGAFGAHLTIAVVFGGNQAIWGSIVPQPLQGRVFAAQQMAVSTATPLAYILAGPLAERFFEPLFAPGGAFYSRLGLLIGSGTGRGIGLIFILLGLAKLALVAAASANRNIREVETNPA